MEALIAKFGARLPLILSRAVAGDPIAIAEIIAAVGVLGYKWIKKNK